jgi:hypothetical protein
VYCHRVTTQLQLINISISIMKFITRNSSNSTLHIGYKEKCIKETMNTKLLGLQIDNHINWKNHKEKMIPKSSEVCYAIRSMVRISNINTLKSVYCVYFHSIVKYEIIFWEGNFHFSKQNCQNYGWCTTQNLL